MKRSLILFSWKRRRDKAKAEAEGLDLAKASFVDPENCDHLNTYIESLCEARKSKGLLQKMQKRSCYPTHCSSEQQW